MSKNTHLEIPFFTIWKQKVENHKVLLLVKFIEMSQKTTKQMHMKHVVIRITWNILVSMNGFRQITSFSYNTSSPAINGLPSDPLFSIEKLSEIAGECIFQVRFSKIFLGEIPHTPPPSGIPPPTLSLTRRFAARKCPFYNVHPALFKSWLEHWYLKSWKKNCIKSDFKEIFF